MSNECNLSAPRIVCAANKCNVTGRILVGARHWDKWMHEQHSIMEANDECSSVFISGVVKYNLEAETQGFIDQHNNFYTREEAWKIAEANNQIIRRVGGDTRNGGTLYSENLY